MDLLVLVQALPVSFWSGQVQPSCGEWESLRRCGAGGNFGVSAVCSLSLSQGSVCMCVHVPGVSGGVVRRFTLMDCRQEYRNFAAYKICWSHKIGVPSTRIVIPLQRELLPALGVLPPRS